MTAPWQFRRTLWEAACFGPILPVIAAVGAITSAVGSVAAGQAQKQAADYNAAVDRNNATQATEASNAQAAVSEQQTTQRLGEQAASYAASGVQVGTGSPLDVMTSTAAQGRLDALTLRYGGQVSAQRDLEAGQLATYQGNQAATAADIGAGTTLLTGGATLAKAEGWNPSF